MCVSLVYHKRVKAVPLQAWSGPEGSKKLRFPDFMTPAQNGGKVVSLTHRPSLPKEINLVLISVRGWVEPRAVVWPTGLCHWKISMTSLGIEPANSRFVAKCLNHYATARLRKNVVGFPKVYQLSFIFHKISDISWLVEKIFASKEDLRTTKLPNAVCW
jgi:hypothetical protein